MYFITIKFSGDIEENTGKVQVSLVTIYLFVIETINSISAHNFKKLSLLRAYISINKFDIICVSETYLDSNILPNDDNLEVPGYTLIRVNPNNTKRGGVSLCQLNSQLLKLLDIQCLNECINFETLMEKCGTFFVFTDPLVKLETPLSQLLIILN